MKRYIILIMLLIPTLAQSQFAGRWKSGANSPTAAHTTLQVDHIQELTSGHTITIDSDLTTLANIIFTLSATESLLVDGNKTNGNLAVFTNEDNGGVGDSTVSITGEAIIVLGNTAPSSKMAGTGGISINQTANDDNIMEFRSSTDVAHGITTHDDTEVYGKFSKIAGINGGLLVRGLSDGYSALSIQGYQAASSTSVSCIGFAVGVKTGTTITTLGATSLAYNFTNNNTTLMGILGGGQIGIGTIAPVANSLTLGTKAKQRDLIVTNENTPAGTDSTIVLTIDDGNGKGYLKSGDGDSLVITCTNDSALIKSNNPIAINGTVNVGTLLEAGVAVLSNDQMDASSELAAIMDDETGSGALMFGTAPTITDSVRVGAAGLWVRKMFQSAGGDSVGLIYYNTVAVRADTVWMTQ